MPRTVLVLSALVAVFLVRLAVGPALGDVRPHQKDMSMEEAVTKAFAATGAKAGELKLMAWRKIGEDAFLPAGELSSLAQHAWRSFAPGQEKRGSLREEPALRSYLLEGEVARGKRIEVQVQTMGVQPGTMNDRPETYLLASMKGEADSMDLASAGRLMTEAFRDFGAPHLSLAISGFLPGKLQPGEQERVAASAFHAVQAVDLEGMREGDLLSRTGYTPLLKQNLSVAGRRVNLNVALRYHLLDDRTYVEVGSPLLDGEY